MNTNTIGNIVKELRVSNGWSQRTLGKMVNCDQTYISQIERGIINPSANLVGNLLKAVASPTPVKKVEPKPQNIIVPKNSQSIELHLPSNQKVVISFM